MGRIERDIWLMDQRLQESSSRTSPAPAMAPAAAFAPAEAPSASAGEAPAAAPEGAPAAVAAPPIAASAVPVGPPTLPPAPAPNRPPLAPGETPPPVPLPWWEYRTQTSGVDIQGGKVALINGATSGFLKGVYPLVDNGRWVVYSILYAEQVAPYSLSACFSRFCCAAPPLPYSYIGMSVLRV